MNNDNDIYSTPPMRAALGLYTGRCDSPYIVLLSEKEAMLPDEEKWDLIEQRLGRISDDLM